MKTLQLNYAEEACDAFRNHLSDCIGWNMHIRFSDDCPLEDGDYRLVAFDEDLEDGEVIVRPLNEVGEPAEDQKDLVALWNEIEGITIY